MYTDETESLIKIYYHSCTYTLRNGDKKGINYLGSSFDDINKVKKLKNKMGNKLVFIDYCYLIKDKFIYESAMYNKNGRTSIFSLTYLYFATN